MLRILLAGGSGFLGKLLTEHLQNDQFIILTRNQTTNTPPSPNVEWLTWQGHATGNWCDQLNQMPPIDAVINLCGDSIEAKASSPNAGPQKTNKACATAAF